MIGIHILCTLLSYVAFLVAFVSGLLFLLQERQLKRKTLGMLFHRLPPLEALDRINFLAVGAGFALLTIGMAFGMIAVRTSLGKWWTGDSKEYLTVVLWITYLTLWSVRVRSTLRGRRVAILSVLGFSLVLFTVVGAAWLLPSWHPYV